ncbi:MAG: nucleotidyltransferase family protein [Candidatus Latescibacteria bacterium]|nr:nucleotidyltransferase family protein [Candidatus Latescibacterota bacterium]
MRRSARLLQAALAEGQALTQLGAGEWGQLAAVAEEEGLEGFYYQRCTAASLVLPASLSRTWQGSYRQTAAANFAALQRLGRVLARVEGGAGQVLLLPGAALLPYYPDPGCRPMDDLDLLVRPEAAAVFDAALAAEGFLPQPRHPGLWAAGPLVLDLHQDLLNTSRIRARRFAAWMDPDEVWRDSRITSVEGVEVAVMGLEDMALYTAVHALRHSFRRLTWFVDLHLLLLAGIDWERLEDKARRYNLVRPLGYGLRFLQQAGGRRLPEPGEALLARIPLRTGEALLLDQIFGDRRRGEWGDVLWAFSIPRWRRRCWFLMETCFPQPKVLLQVFPYLPAPLFPLAYGLRLMQLLFRGGRQLCWLLCRPSSRAERIIL